jgi:hypothetical protein
MPADTITITTVRETEAMLDAYLSGLTDTLERERAERQAERDRIEQVSWKVGLEHGGSYQTGVDEILQSAGLRPTPMQIGVSITAHFEERTIDPYEKLRLGGRETGAANLFINRTGWDTEVTVRWSLNHYVTLTLPPEVDREKDCYCDDVAAMVKDGDEAVRLRLIDDFGGRDLPETVTRTFMLRSCNYHTCTTPSPDGVPLSVTEREATPS